MEKTRRDFNNPAQFFLGLSMFATIMTIINSFLHINLFGASDSLVIEIVIDFLILVAAVLTFMKKRLGLVALVALFIIRLFATIPIGTNISTASYLGAKTATLLRDIGPFAIAMCFKKNGISGWKSMLASEEYVARHTIVPSNDGVDSASMDNADGESLNHDETKFSSAVIPVSESTSVSGRAFEEKKEPGTIREDVVESRITIPVNEGKNPVSEERKKTIKEKIFSINKFKRAAILSTFALILLFAILAIVVAVKSYPDYVSSFSDKWKYTFNLSNDQLATRLMNEIHGRDTTGYFVVEFSDGDVIGYTKEYYFDNRIDIHREWHPIRVYTSIKQVKTSKDIGLGHLYAKPDSVYWRILGEQEIEDLKDKWEETIKESPGSTKMTVFEIIPYDYDEGLKKEMSIADIAATIPVRDIETADQVGLYYFLEENYTKASDYYRFLLKKQPRNPAIKGRLAMSLTMGGDYENARFYAEEALEKNPKEVTAQSALALIEAENYNWGEVKKWARKAIDYGSEDSNVYYAYCEALYKQGEVKAAHEYYNKAYELYRYNPRRSKFKEYAGCPFEVLSIHYGAIKETKTGTQFTIPIDGKLLSSQCYYVVFQLDVNYLRNEKATVGVKLFTNDKLKTGTPSRDGFTYTHDVIGSEPGKTIVKLSGWGNNSGDSWSVGQHRIELWYNGEKIAEDSFRIY